MAGSMAAKIFSAQTWVSCACGSLLLLKMQQKQALAPVHKAQAAIVYIALGVLLALLVELFITPRIVARENLRLWHAVGSAMYLLQWVCAAMTLWKLTGSSQYLLSPVSPQV